MRVFGPVGLVSEMYLICTKTWLDQTDEMMKELQQLLPGHSGYTGARWQMLCSLATEWVIGLLNILATERAIVTPMAGTTRDVIEESIEIAGPFSPNDTACAKRVSSC